MSVVFDSSNEHLIPEGLFFTLPSELLEKLESFIGADRFDADRWGREKHLASLCSVGGLVGFWRRQPISYDLLRPARLGVSAADGAGLGWTPEQIESVNTRGADLIDWTANIACAYAGWLLTNSSFLAEHARIFEVWQAQLAEYGIPQMGVAYSDASRISGARLAESDGLQDFVCAFEEFFVRWRLQGMAAPFLPRPLGPQLPVPVLAFVLGHMQNGGRTFYVPDTFPVPSRDELRRIMEDALRGGDAPEHLQEWFEIVHSSNPSRNILNRYARLLAVQHYWRALFERHGEELRRARGVVGQVFAEFLGTSHDTIRDDLDVIAARLGDDWHLQSR